MVPGGAEHADQEEGRHATSLPLAETGGSVQVSGPDPAERSARKGGENRKFCHF